MKKLKYHPNSCEKPWVWVERFMDSRWYKVRLLDLDRICSKCENLKKCQASVLIKVHKKLTGRI